MASYGLCTPRHKSKGNISVVVAIDTETGVGMVTSLGIDVARYKYLRGYLKKHCLKGPLNVFSYDR